MRMARIASLSEVEVEVPELDLRLRPPALPVTAAAVAAEEEEEEQQRTMKKGEGGRNL